jgi:hypothetical protein
MSLWGANDLIAVPGFTDGTTCTIVGTATSEHWTAAGAGVTAAPEGSVAVFGDIDVAAGRSGFGVVIGVDGVDRIRITPNSATTGAHRCVFSEQPKYLRNDPAFAPFAGPISPVDGRTTRVGVVTAGDVEDEKNTIWKAGVGYVGVTTYTVTNNETGITTTRVKTEILVAGSSYGINTYRPYPEAFGPGS